MSGESNRLIRGISIILFANIIRAAFNVAFNLLLPKYLTVEAYAEIKLFQLYASYAHLLHFGFADGVYLEYGGQELDSIPPHELARRLSTLRWLQLGCMATFLAVVPFVREPTFIYVVLDCALLNMIEFFQSLYQATGKYFRYSLVTNASTILRTACSVTLLIALSSDVWKWHVISYIVIDACIFFALEIHFRKTVTMGQPIADFSPRLLADEIRSGFVLQLTVLSGQLLAGMDRIFVKVLLGTLPFAHYAFAASVDNLLNVLITPVTTTLYRYFCIVKGRDEICRTRNLVMMASVSMLLLYFPLDLIIRVLLGQYVASLHVLAILMASKGMYMIVQGVYVNLYKARKKQFVYIRKLLLVVAIGAATNAGFYRIMPVKESFAVATLLTSAIWLVICARDFRQVSFRHKEILYLTGCIGFYLFCSLRMSPLVGGASYLACVPLMSWLLFPEDVRMSFSYVRDSVRFGAMRRRQV